MKPFPETRYVIVHRMGGLGNQLFQYAAARAVAHYHPGTLIYVERETENPHNLYGYDYAERFMTHAVMVVNPSLTTTTPFTFKQSSSFMPWDPQTIHPPVRLSGYFQYLPALQPILPDLIREFQLALRDIVPATPITDPQKSLFVHVRRGDYLTKPHYHCVQTLVYYERAFQQWRQQCRTGKDDDDDEFQVFLVSDDPFWCRCQPWSFPYTLYENPDEMETLALMSQCQAGAIIGNSTFSYWGAMLSQSEHVFYPERWIAETVYDLFPSHWCCVSG